MAEEARPRPQTLQFRQFQLVLLALEPGYEGAGASKCIAECAHLPTSPSP